MNILFLHRYIPEYSFDEWLNAKWIECIYKMGTHGIKVYGPMMWDAFPHMCVCKYDENLTLEQLRSFYGFDVIIVNTKSRCFFYYDPKANRAEGCWLPKDFTTFTKSIPRLILDQDSHYEKDGKWLQEMKFDMILQRHYSQSLRDWGIPCKWLPFSVDTSTFHKDRLTCDHKGVPLRLPPYEQRIKKICFTGNNADDAYVIRRTAINRLLAVGVAANFAGAKKVDGEYVQVLRQYVGYLSCGSIYEITAAKNFEIMASGGVLLTNRFKGIELLFPDNCYVPYSNDCCDIEVQANRILNDVSYTANIVQKAHECIRARHTHEVRMNELVDIIQKMR